MSMFYRGQPHTDDRDQAIRERRAAMLAADESTHPRVGDWIVFACGTARRVSHVHDFGPRERSYQTSAEGPGYYLGEYGPEWGGPGAYVSYSGTLFRSVPLETLTFTGETRDGRVWFFHRDWREAHNGVETTVPFRVYTCTEPAPE